MVKFAVGAWAAQKRAIVDAARTSSAILWVLIRLLEVTGTETLEVIFMV
jgi:hypothetical protein